MIEIFILSFLATFFYTPYGYLFQKGNNIRSLSLQLIFGLILSVVLTGALATYLANYIQKHLWIAYVGLVFIVLVALQLVIGGLVDLEILSINEQFKKYF